MTRNGRYLACWLGLVVTLTAPLAARTTAIFTSLPIIWPEAEDVASVLSAMDKVHWAKDVLSRRGGVLPIDRVLPDGPEANSADLLVMIQPRALAPDENVALDRWLRRGGRILLFADPMLTADSTFPLGDRRRPQAIAMLQPLLRHWGLRLDFDAEQPAGERRANAFGTDMPVDLPGKLVRIGRRGPCVLAVEGIAARCRIGRGMVLIVADAALFEEQATLADDRRAAFESLLARIDGEQGGVNRENSGWRF